MAAKWRFCSISVTSARATDIYLCGLMKDDLVTTRFLENSEQCCRHHFAKGGRNGQRPGFNACYW